MPIINLNQMHQNESSRNFDDTVDANTLVSAENSQGTFGAFKFFTGIKAFFKGISALGTLTTTSRIPVTDSNGNVSYTTPTAIKDLFNISKATALTSNDDLNNVKTEGFYFSNGAVLPTNAPSGTSATLYNYVLHVYPQGNTSRVVQEFTTLNGQNKYMRFYGVSGNTWSSWQKLATETDLNGALADYEKVFKYNVTFGVALNTSEKYEGFKTFILSKINEWNDGDIVKIINGTEKANFHVQKINNSYFNIFYMTYYISFPTNYRYINGTWQKVEATTQMS